MSDVRVKLTATEREVVVTIADDEAEWIVYGIIPYEEDVMLDLSIKQIANGFVVRDFVSDENSAYFENLLGVFAHVMALTQFSQGAEKLPIGPDARQQVPRPASQG